MYLYKIYEKKLKGIVNKKTTTVDVCPCPVKIGNQLFFGITLFNKISKKEEYLYLQI